MTEQETKNQSELAAWNAWKEVCWVHGVGKKLDPAEPIHGTAEEEKLLAQKIRFCFARKLATFGMAMPGEDCDCAQEFDAALKELETGVERDRRFAEYTARAKKCWKDDVWAAVAASDDPPLKVIRGKLLGPEGVINDVVERWLMKNHSCRLVKRVTQDGRTVKVLQIADDDSVLAEHPTVPLEGAGLPDCPAPITTSLPSVVEERLKETLPVAMCCALFAKANDIAVYGDATLLRELNLSGSSGYYRLLQRAQEAVRGLDAEVQEWICESPASFLAWIRNRIVGENAGRLLLLQVETLEG